MHVTKPDDFIKFGAMDGTKPYECLKFGLYVFIRGLFFIWFWLFVGCCWLVVGGARLFSLENARAIAVYKSPEQRA